MGKVRPFCRSGLEANILRPYCGLLCKHFLPSLSLQTYRQTDIHNLKTMSSCVLAHNRNFFILIMKGLILCALWKILLMAVGEIQASPNSMTKML